MAPFSQLDLFSATVSAAVLEREPKAASSTTFIPNQELPVHRWFRYSAGFSGKWAEAVIASRGTDRRLVVLDPFVGCGTTLIAAQMAGASSVGLEAHPFVHRIAAAKLCWTTSPARFEETASKIVQDSRDAGASVTTVTAALLSKIYDPSALTELVALRSTLEALENAQSDVRLVWLALVSILRACSRANTAPWQYVLPKKTKVRVAQPFDAFLRRIRLMSADMQECQSRVRLASPALLLLSDARTCQGVDDASVDLVLTSPPYPNNYDYADATRVEMTFLGDVSRWADLHRVVRHHLLPSCSQHADLDKLEVSRLLQSPVLAPVREELDDVCGRLARCRGERAGHKSYDGMIAGYFVAMGEVWTALARVVKPGGSVCFVIGDSAPYGVHVPVERWLGQLAEGTGFNVVTFEETRRRNLKWKNRKHRVPLREGRLWLTRV
jgi:DNA modification methylase